MYIYLNVYYIYYVIVFGCHIYLSSHVTLAIMNFSTYDRDQDHYTGDNCAQDFHQMKELVQKKTLYYVIVFGCHIYLSSHVTLTNPTMVARPA